MDKILIFGEIFLKQFFLKYILLHRRHVVSFGQGSSLLWTHTLRPSYSRPIALTQQGGVWLMMCANVCVTEG